MWRLRDAYEGTQIFGATGSGKTSGSGAAIARAFLRAQMGGLVCCAKPEERTTWEQYAKETGREKSLIIISPDGPHRFNFIDYEQRRAGAGAGQTENLVNLLTVVTEIAEGKVDSASADPFWPRATRQLLRNAIDLITLAGDAVTLDTISELVASAPITAPQSDEWRDGNTYCATCIRKAVAAPKSPRQVHDLGTAGRYWLKSFATMNDRTRTSIIATFTATADLISHGIAWELLGEELTISPESALDGGIIVLDLPIQEYGEVGRVVQGIWKYMFQRAMLRRNVVQDPRPVFLWCDESQNFINSYDYEFQATARSARAATVYLTQNISNYHAKLGTNGHAAALALLGNFQTKVFHANGDYVTNQYAADTLGQHLVYLEGENLGASMADQQSTGSYSESRSQQLQYKILPADFARLRKGGPENNLMVDGVIFQGGREWKANGDTYLRASFKQQ